MQYNEEILLETHLHRPIPLHFFEFCAMLGGYHPIKEHDLLPKHHYGAPKGRSTAIGGPGQRLSVLAGGKDSRK